MVVSERNRYVFIQIPQAASTAIGEELITHYDGRSILHKHATYHHFKAWAGPDASRYFVFASIRNPLETLVSLYYKMQTNHRGGFTNPATWKRYGGWKSNRELRRFRYICDKSASFDQFFRRFYWYPYVELGALNRKYCDFVIRYETLQQDFATVLKMREIAQVRELPRVNPTKKSTKPVLYHYSKSLRRSCWVMGPILRYLEYEVPEEWGCHPRLDIAADLSFDVVKYLKRLHFKYVA